MAFKLVGVRKSDGQRIEYGPWDAALPAPGEAETVMLQHPVVITHLSNIAFAQGFMCAEFARNEETRPEDINFELEHIPNAAEANALGTLQAYATASVTHADGTTD
jgi:hypothetical protein